MKIKPRTYVVDIDGTVLLHAQHWLGDLPHATVEGAVETLQRWESEGHHIVLMTARPEPQRARTEAALHKAGAVWHQLVMGVSGGVRVLVNDIRPSGLWTATALNVRRDTTWKAEALAHDIGISREENDHAR